MSPFVVLKMINDKDSNTFIYLDTIITQDVGSPFWNHMYKLFEEELNENDVKIPTDEGGVEDNIDTMLLVAAKSFLHKVVVRSRLLP